MKLGEKLQKDLDALQLTQEEAADKLRMSRTNLSSILNGHRALSAAVAIKLEKLVGNPASYWMRLQAEEDLEKQRRGKRVHRRRR